MSKTFPDFSFETSLWGKGFKFVAGIDEVGRGAFAGPVVAGAVVFDSDARGPAAVFPPGTPTRGPLPGGAPSRVTPRTTNIPADREIIINDSKLMKAKDREVAAEWIKENALAWGIGEVSVAIINRVGIGRAAKMAMRRAIREVNEKFKIQNEKLDFLLIDAFYVTNVPGLQKNRQMPIIKGDQKSLSIAAASIIAKVYRDSLLTQISLKNTNYGWERNKGYGTPEHQKAIQVYGLTRFHRKAFVESWKSRLQNS